MVARAQQRPIREKLPNDIGLSDTTQAVISDDFDDVQGKE